MRSFSYRLSKQWQWLSTVLNANRHSRESNNIYEGYVWNKFSRLDHVTGHIDIVILWMYVVIYFQCCKWLQGFHIALYVISISSYLWYLNMFHWCSPRANIRKFTFDLKMCFQCWFNETHFNFEKILSRRFALSLTLENWYTLTDISVVEIFRNQNIWSKNKLFDIFVKYKLFHWQ